MNRRRKLNLFLGLLLFAVALSPVASQACAVCYGDPDSPMSKGLTWGITALLVVVASVLGGIASFFVYIAKKSSTESTTDKV